jgi:hypothetical protein
MTPASALVFRRMAERIWEMVGGGTSERRPPPGIIIE